MSKDFMEGYKRYDPSEEGFGSSYQWKRSFHHRMSKEEAETIIEEESSDPYDILGVTRRSSQSEIKKAFYRLAMKWHPDRNPDRIELATKNMQLINAAYSILMN
jgi:DnaJ-class molecular chaperone